jgi:SpoVK/Ycf46/Vps4 family AAA+-type ATPase
LGKETGRPVLQLDVGNLMGSLVGQTEERTRQVLRIADAMQPCILMIDELEKAFAGVTGAQGDSGVSSRMFGSFLTWLNDHDSDVFVVCTSNDVSRLPPEMSRAERFDAVYFVDLPTPQEKDSIWKLYRQQYGIGASEKRPNDTNWTGAEIKSACRLAALLDLPLAEASENVVPVAVTAAESIDKLKSWASGRCLSASQRGLYQKNTGDAGPRRRVSRGDHTQN